MTPPVPAKGIFPRRAATLARPAAPSTHWTGGRFCTTTDASFPAFPSGFADITRELPRHHEFRRIA